MDATSYVLELSDWVTFSISSFTVYGSASNFTFTGLVPGRYYSISVTVNCTGGSYVSDTVYDSTLTSYTIVTIINKTMTSITVSWMTSLPNAYYYWIYMTETISGRQIYYLFSFSNTYTLTNLVPGMNYSVYVTAYNGTSSQISDVVMDSTLSSYTLVTITNKTMTSITISCMTSLPNAYFYWNYMTETMSGYVNYYLYSYSNTYTFTNLVPGRNYSVSVTAYHGSSSQISDVVMDRTLPPKVNASVLVKTTTTMTISWPTNPWDVDYFIVILNETTNTSVTHTLNVSSSPATFTYLVPGSNYSASVVSHSGRNATPSDKISDRTYPATVRGFYCFKYSTENISCSWSLPIGVWSLLYLEVINAPPPVPNTVTITTVQNQVTLSSLTVYFSCSWFQNTNGDLKYYTVIVKQSEGNAMDVPEIWLGHFIHARLK
ncbi:receptor-type tyrosine-protein phosphatase beta-like [Lampetra planeri]